MKSTAAQPLESASVPELIVAAEQALPTQAHALQRARAFAEPLIAAETLDTGENTLAHADAVAAILKAMGGSEAMQAASYLVYACAHLNKPQEVIAKAFGDSFAALAMDGVQHVLLAREHLVERAEGDTGFGGHGLHARLVVALLREHALGRREDRSPIQLGARGSHGAPAALCLSRRHGAQTTSSPPADHLDLRGPAASACQN